MFTAYAPALVDYIHFIDNFPNRGGHAVIKSTYRMPGGAGCNVAHNLATAGIDATIFTTLGKDEDAEFFVRNTAAKVIAAETDEFTGKVDVFVDKSGERTFFVHPNAAGKPYVEVDPAEYLYLDPFPSEMSFDLQLEVAKKHDGTVILNPGFPYVTIDFEKFKLILKYTNILILSTSEFDMLGVDVNDILKLVDYLVITQGSRGSTCYTEHASFQAEAPKVNVIDTTGAGDAFAAGFILGFIKGLDIEVCLKIGNFCGAYNVERVGARNFPSRQQIEKFLARVLSKKL
jgi:ribokinase